MCGRDRWAMGRVVFWVTGERVCRSWLWPLLQALGWTACSLSLVCSWHLSQIHHLGWLSFKNSGRAWSSNDCWVFFCLCFFFDYRYYFNSQHKHVYFVLPHRSSIQWNRSLHAMQPSPSHPAAAGGCAVQPWAPASTALCRGKACQAEKPKDRSFVCRKIIRPTSYQELYFIALDVNSVLLQR